MATELIVQNAVYQPDQQRLEIVLALVEFQLLDITTTVTDKATGQQISQIVETQKNVQKAFGETIYCADVNGHTHVAVTCAKAHPEYANKKTVLSGRLSEWKTKAPAVIMTPADRKLE